MKILFIGDIVGKGGIFTVKNLLPELKKERGIDFVIAHCNGATGGFGMGRNHAMYLHKLGIDCLTSGECVYYKKDIIPFIGKSFFLLKPANLPTGTPGRGWSHFTVKGKKVAVVSMMGQNGYMKMHTNNPFTYIPDLVERVKQQTPLVIFNFNALTTAEKQTMLHLMDGKLGAVIGSGARALTADGRVTEKGTAFITDAGRTGSLLSVAGLNRDIEIRKHLTQIPERSSDASEALELQGVLIELDDDTGKAVSLETLRVPCSKEME
ncbi:MAG: TIGR00282 family metallophosphoesterase [Spirochaetales bacterium]|nr:TIGR00282 family metallophosphoesterase [Spirochaetales bacterium]